MAAHLSDSIFPPVSGFRWSPWRLTIQKPPGVSLRRFTHSKHGNTVFDSRRQNLKWALKLSLVEQIPSKSTTFDINRLVEFLYDDLPHLFDDQGIDRTMYDERVRFRDPITKHDTVDGYLFNIALLKILFQPDFQLHNVKQTGPCEITTRWTMVMKFMLLPWKPELVFTGISIMGINPETQKFCSHVDIWDSIENNDYFSVEGLWDVIRQFVFLCSYVFTRLQIWNHQSIKSSRELQIMRYIFGKNSSMEKIPMTTPVFTQAYDSELSNISIQVVLPLERDLNSLPDTSQDEVSLRKVDGGIAAVTKFSGRPTEEIVHEKEKALRSALLRDGLIPKKGCLLARYNDPGRTWSFIMRNEVLIWLEEYKLE
ncbi:uncharacterized protein LOC122672643 isoform X2 [Telopea speciosissima]|uniref:uncharacterized protein LOC122672643 isoform X2 n=1 Tax=Telopea speciosissima TaxID=54955 RepID=UPI001CC3DF85|nr:uncharacterized protein LOC122672643 isoform X2 [Telopea speciosissima]